MVVTQERKVVMVAYLALFQHREARGVTPVVALVIREVAPDVVTVGRVDHPVVVPVVREIAIVVMVIPAVAVAVAALV
jgi:hypothetical protein